jgi:hypothetical protein
MPDIFDEVEVPETDIFDQVSMDGPSPSTARDTGITVGAQFAQAPQVIAQTLDESGAQTMAGLNYLRARLIREGVRKPVDETSGTGNIRDYISLAGEEPESFYAPQRGQTMDAFVKAEEARGKAVLEEGQFYSRAAEELPQKYGLNPDLESGLVTQVVRGLTKGAAIAAMAEVGGIPALALQGATEAYGAARSGGANDNEAIDQSVKTLIGLAVFGASNKAVASGISKYIGDAPKLQTFLTQALGQSAGNELTSRVITAWESAVEAPPDQRAEAALAALAESDAGAIAQNIGFGVMGAAGASRRAISKARRESSNRLPEVEMENQLRAVREEEQAKASASRPTQFTGPMAQSRLEVAAETRNVVPETEVLGASADPMAIIAPPDDKKKGKITQLISDRQKITDTDQRQSLFAEAVKLRDEALKVTEPPVPEPLAPPSEAPLPFPLEAPKPSPVSEQAKLDALRDLIRPKAPEAQAPPQPQTTGKSTPAETAPRPQEKEVAASLPETKPLTDKEKSQIERLRARLSELEADRKFAEDEGNIDVVDHVDKVAPALRKQLEALEDRLPPDAPRTTGIRNAITDEVAASMGLPERGTPERYSAEQQLADAQKAISDNPKLGEVIVTELAESPRALDTLENNVMAFEFAARQTEFNAATKAALSAKTPEAQLAAELRVQKARDAVQELIEATRATGTLQGRALESRKRLVEQQYELPIMQAEARIARGKMTPEEAKKLDAEIEALHKELESVKAELAKRDTQTAEKEAERTLSNLIREETRAARSAKKTGRSFMDVLKEGHDKALKNIRERSGRTSAGVDPTVLADVARIGAYKIAQGVVKIADFTRDMVRDIGEWVRPSIDDVFAQSQKLHAEANKAYTSANAKPVAIEAAKANAAAGKPIDQKIIYDLAREKVNAGVKGLDEVMEAVRRDLDPLHPGITVREIRDTFSDYGKVKFPSREADKTQLRKYRRMSQLVSAIEDAQKKLSPKKTGLQRDKAEQEVRDLQKQLQKVMREQGIETTSPEQQLASANAARRTALENQIEDLDRQLRTGEKPAKGQPVSDTVEVERLRSLRDALREKVREIEEASKVKKTPEEIALEQRIKATNKSIEELDLRLQEGDLAPKDGKPQPTSAELERLQSMRDSMRAQLQEMRANARPEQSPEQQALNDAIVSRERWQRILDGEATATKPAAREALTQIEEDVRLEIEGMKQLVRELKIDAKGSRADAKEKAQIKAIEKSIGEYERRVNAMDFAPKGRQHGPPRSEELAKAQSAQKAAKEMYERAKGFYKPVADPVARRLATNKKLAELRIKKLEERIRTADYSKPVKADPVTDKDLIDLRFKEAKLKEQYLADLFLDRMKKRTWSEKTVDAVWEVAGLSRVLTTAYDIGALLNQGKMLLGRPVIYGKAVAHMFRSISEKGEFRAQKEMEARDNFKNGNYKTAKLALTDPNAVSLSKVEEDFQSRWANKIPGIKQSNRAYSSFLNRLRMDTFDAMLDSWFPGGASKKDMQDMAALVNDATGRGSLGKTIEPAAPLLNRLFFAAKYQTARLSIMTGYRLLKPGISWQVRKAIAAEYGRIILGLSAYYGLLIAMQDDKDPRVGLNPLKKDTFLTIRYGDTRLNPVGPIKGWLANESQMAAGKKIDKDGKTMKLSPIQKQLQDSSFVRSKFSPALGNFVDWRWGSTFSGEPFRMFPENVDQLMKGESVAPGAFTPMSVSNVYETLKAHRSAKGIALSILGVAGESENTYPDKDKK